MACKLLIINNLAGATGLEPDSGGLSNSLMARDFRRKALSPDSVDPNLRLPSKADPSRLDDHQVPADVFVGQGTERIQDLLVHLPSRKLVRKTGNYDSRVHPEGEMKDVREADVTREQD